MSHIITDVNRISKELDGRGKWTGHRFLMRGRVVGESKCPLCGRWFTWIDFEPPHCGNMGCEDFWYRRAIHVNKMAHTDTKEREKFFNNPSVVKNIINKTKDFFKAGVI